MKKREKIQKISTFILTANIIILSSNAIPADIISEPICPVENEGNAQWIGLHKDNSFSRSKETWLFYDTGVDEHSVGVNGGGLFRTAIRFTPEELTPYTTWKVMKVKFFHSGGTHHGRVCLYATGTASSPGPLLISEPFSAVGPGWCQVPLPSAIPIVFGEDLWVSVEFDSPSGQPIMIDTGPVIAGKGDWYFSPGYGRWIEMCKVTSFNSNFMIRAQVCGYDLLNITQIRGPLGVYTTLTNDGSIDLHNVDWVITLDGVKGGTVQVKGRMPLLKTQSAERSWSGLIWGFGIFDVTISAEAENAGKVEEHTFGLLLGIFTFIKNI